MQAFILDWRITNNNRLWIRIGWLCLFGLQVMSNEDDYNVHLIHGIIKNNKSIKYNNI